MSTDLPPTIGGDTAEIVFPWKVPITIDGVESEIRGELLWFPGVNPVGPVLVGAVALLATLVWRRRHVRPLAEIASASGAFIVLVAITRYAATPATDRGLPTEAIFPIVAVMLAVGVLWIGTNARNSWLLLGVAGLALIWWAVGAADTLTAPVLPSALPTFVERAAVSLSAWMGLALAGISAYEFATGRRVHATV